MGENVLENNQLETKTFTYPVFQLNPLDIISILLLGIIKLLTLSLFSLYMYKDVILANCTVIQYF